MNRNSVFSLIKQFNMRGHGAYTMSDERAEHLSLNMCAPLEHERDVR